MRLGLCTGFWTRACQFVTLMCESVKESRWPERQSRLRVGLKYEDLLLPMLWILYLVFQFQLPQLLAEVLNRDS